MVGIYSRINKLNGKRYIGQSIDIEQRKKQHIASINKGTTKLALALSKYGLENFDFQIIEITSPELLNEREHYWIHYYDTIKNGYNITDIDENGCIVRGENNPNTSLTNQDVLDIRNRIHVNHEHPKDVYQQYESKISYSEFWSIFHGET